MGQSPTEMTLADLRVLYSAEGPVTLALSDADVARIGAAEATVNQVLADGKTVYGVNTGFGILAKERIEPGDLAQLQKNLVLSHAAGVGRDLDANIVRLIMTLKAASLARGHSGVKQSTVETLLALLKADVIPAIPEKGSVGASGDLAPLAALAGVMMGSGHAYVDGNRLSAMDGLQAAGVKPCSFGPKEGLALLNGTQVSTALALAGLFRIEAVFAAALAAGALSVDAAMGSDVPFDPRIHAARGQPGQIDVAASIRAALAGSDIRTSHVDCEKVQDPYCLRCMPQVMGAALDNMRHAAAVLGREAQAASDNPLIFADDGDILSGGNFHAEPVAMAADVLAIAIAEIGSMSERRTALLMDTNISGLPAFLIEKSGLNSGFMIPQVTAAALVSENKLLSHPASVDSIPTSANQEDHVSMATHGARRLLDMSQNAAGVVAIELLAASQGVDFRAPLKTSPANADTMKAVRSVAAHLGEDRPFTPDIEAVTTLILDGRFNSIAKDILPSVAGH